MGLIPFVLKLLRSVVDQEKPYDQLQTGSETMSMALLCIAMFVQVK